MIKNREELMALSNEWATMAKNDLRGQIIAFMEDMQTNEEEVADALCISMGELMQIIEGNGEISLTTFAKILIATDNVIEIKPLSAMGMQNMPSPRGGHGQMGQGVRQMSPQGRPMPRGGMPMPHGGQMPPMPQGGQRRPMPQGGMPIPRGGQMPPMPQGGMPVGERFGGMPGMGRKIQERQQATHPMNVNRQSMITELQRNFWDSEVNINEMSDKDLFDFLNSKTVQSENRCSQPEVQPRQERTQRVQHTQERVETQAVDPANDFLGILMQTLEQNPHLRDEIAKYLPKQG